MRQALLRLRQDIVEAVQQDDARFLVVPSTDAELPYAVHAVSAYQEAFPHDFIVSFATVTEVRSGARQVAWGTGSQFPRRRRSSRLHRSAAASNRHRLLPRSTQRAPTPSRAATMQRETEYGAQPTLRMTRSDHIFDDVSEPMPVGVFIVVQVPAGTDFHTLAK